MKRYRGFGFHALGRVQSLVFVAAFSLWLQRANAQVVSFNFTGTVGGIVDSATYLPDDLASGQTVSGTISYNTANTSDANPGDPNYARYPLASGDFSLTVSVTTPSHTYVFSSVGTPPINNNDIILVRPSGGTHHIEYNAGDPFMDASPLPSTPNGSVIALNLDDSTGQVFSNDSLPTSAPVFGAFTGHSLNLVGYTVGGNPVYSMSATVTSITPVPEPRTALLASGLCLGIFAVVRSNRGLFAIPS